MQSQKVSKRSMYTVHDINTTGQMTMSRRVGKRRNTKTGKGKNSNSNYLCNIFLKYEGSGKNVKTL